MKTTIHTLYQILKQYNVSDYTVLSCLVFAILIYPSAIIDAQDMNCSLRSDWTANYVVQRGDNLYQIAKSHNVDLLELANANCIENIQVIHAGLVLRVPSTLSIPTHYVPVTLVAANDNGQNGVLLGCGDSAVEVATPYRTTGDLARDMQITLETIFGNRSFSNVPTYLINPWGNTYIRVNNLSVQNGVASISLSGNFTLVGTCGDARFLEQLRHNIFMYPQVETAYVTLNGQNILTIFDQSGLLPSNAPFERLITPERCPIPIGWHEYQIPAKTNLYQIAQKSDSNYLVLQDRNCLPDANRIIAGTTIYTPKLIVDEVDEEEVIGFPTS